ncbi:MAG: ATP-binding cassette domain-containing protein [Methanobrevibacter sp.]|uniref:ATP-binding cassette domain-containing protein n=1 Tax=Methanobrevibacter sp. TaxID=66852 RepID=UPI0026E01859|nr:ATP-binding cassette domain-containing protein [Methanobrevibacter sp.]MDO5849365.1 ATP-binding cassette domain-containing protein [Methanobrevibacter sp.]
MLEAKNLFYSYGDGTNALNGVNMDIKKGEIVALLGKNGAGKSTLFLHFNGILRPDKGEIKIDGEKLKYDKKSLIKARQKVGIVFQNPDDQIFAPSVEEDVAFGPLNLKLPMEEVQKRVTEALNRVGMGGFEKKAPHHLSGGQKKRVAIAGILAMNPDIMILDEPIAGLDPVGANKIINLLKELNEEGMTILISTHDVNLIQEYADKIFVINEGQIIGDGNPKDIFSNKELLKEANLKLPIIAQLFEKLEDNDIIPKKNKFYPLNIDEAYLEIKKLLK